MSVVVKAVQTETETETETVRFGGTAQQMFMQAATAVLGRVMTVL